MKSVENFVEEIRVLWYGCNVHGKRSARAHVKKLYERDLKVAQKEVAELEQKLAYLRGLK